MNPLFEDEEVVSSLGNANYLDNNLGSSGSLRRASSMGNLRRASMGSSTGTRRNGSAPPTLPSAGSFVPTPGSVGSGSSNGTRYESASSRVGSVSIRGSVPGANSRVGTIPASSRVGTIPASSRVGTIPASSRRASPPASLTSFYSAVNALAQGTQTTPQATPRRTTNRGTQTTNRGTQTTNRGTQTTPQATMGNRWRGLLKGAAKRLRGVRPNLSRASSASSASSTNSFHTATSHMSSTTPRPTTSRPNTSRPNTSRPKVANRLKAAAKGVRAGAKAFATEARAGAKAFGDWVRTTAQVIELQRKFPQYSSKNLHRDYVERLQSAAGRLAKARARYAVQIDRLLEHGTLEASVREALANQEELRQIEAEVGAQLNGARRGVWSPRPLIYQPGAAAWYEPAVRHQLHRLRERAVARNRRLGAPTLYSHEDRAQRVRRVLDGLRDGKAPTWQEATLLARELARVEEKHGALSQWERRLLSVGPVVRRLVTLLRPRD